MQKVFDNLINGNLEDAKKGAKRYSVAELEEMAHEWFQFSLEKTLHAVRYLKGTGSFQAYCDAK